MPLEAVTYISDLVATNPVNATDQVAQGDDHIRNIKTALLNTFPSVTGAVTLTHTQINNAALKAASNVFTGSQQIIQANPAELLLWNTAAGAGLKQWALQAESDGDLSLFTRNDAGGGIENAFVFSRNASSEVTLLAFSGDAITMNGVNVTDYARKSQANTFTADQTISKASPFFIISSNTASDSALQLATNGTTRGYVAAPGGAGGMVAGSAIGDLVIRAQSGGLIFTGDAGTTAHFKLSAAGVVTTPNASAGEVGTKGAPGRNVAATTNTAATDAGGTIHLTGGAAQTFTLDGDPPTDSIVVIDNQAGASWTIAASGTLTWAATGGAGSRTLANGGMAVALHLGAGSWKINGGGLS